MQKSLRAQLGSSSHLWTVKRVCVSSNLSEIPILLPRNQLLLCETEMKTTTWRKFLSYCIFFLPTFIFKLAFLRMPTNNENLWVWRNYGWRGNTLKNMQILLRHFLLLLLSILFIIILRLTTDDFNIQLQRLLNSKMDLLDNEVLITKKGRFYVVKDELRPL